MNYFLNFLGNLYNFFNLSFNSNEFLNNSVDWNGDLNWYSERFINLNNLLDFDNLWNNSIYLNFSWNLDSNFDYFLAFLFDDSDNLADFLVWYNLLNDSLNDSIDLVVDIFNNFNFFNSFLNNWNLNQFLNLSYPFHFDDSVYNFFYNLRNFNNLFNDSWDYYDLFNDFLDLNNFWNLDHFLNNFVNIHSDLFNSFNSSWNFDYFFNNYLDWIVLGNVVIYWLFNFNNFVHFDNFVD